jgi:hypothetical protein
MARKKVGKKKGRKWLQEARARMEEKGSVGSFGKATPKKIAAGKRKGGVQKKKAVFAMMAKRGFKPLPKNRRKREED